jgi:hypothetical protein
VGYRLAGLSNLHNGDAGGRRYIRGVEIQGGSFLGNRLGHRAWGTRQRDAGKRRILELLNVEDQR